MKTVGVDIIEIERVAQSIERFGDRFLKRVYTKTELAYCQGRVGSLAARWAAKEATAKALGTGIGEVSWQEIEVVGESNGCPALCLHGAAADLAARLGISELAISLSHTRDHAVAFVVGE
ncbi:MAG: holo-ACP synthase [Anaerolineae bacterium]|nr:holo-ACP synthase [Anaerolineae bacterium]